MDRNTLDSILEKITTNSGLVPKVLGSLFLLVLAMSSFYTVGTDEEAVIQRLGTYNGTVGSGLNFKIPFVDTVNILKTKQILQYEFGFRTKKIENNSTEYSSNSSVNEESSMLSGDLNVADVEWVIQYQITNPSDYLFKTKNPEQNIRDVSESVMRRLVGDRMVSEVLTTGRTEIEAQSKILIQEALNKYNQGVTIVSVQLQDINPPEEVKEAFNEVNKAKQDQEKMINLAEQKYNDIIPKAEGVAQEQISAAEGYATKVYNQALGDVAKFEKVQEEYKISPEITKKRIYLETMEEIFKNRKMTIIDSNFKGSIVPLLNMQNKTKENN